MPVDVNEQSVRVRVKMPGDFQEGSFRTIAIDKAQGIKAVIGRPKGQDSTQVQSYIFDKEKWTPAEASKWVASHGKKIMSMVGRGLTRFEGYWLAEPEQDELELDMAAIDDDENQLRDVEIMAAGTWKGFKFTAEDLDNMVENFKRVPLRVPMKLGHGEQKMAQREGLPAFGWVDKLVRKGEKLLATFSHIPAKLLELIRLKHYIRFSAEIRRNFLFNGNVYGNVLSGVALLGEELPAVQKLDDIFDLHAAKAASYAEGAWPESGTVVFVNDNDAGKGGDDMAELKEVEAKLADTEKEKAKIANDLEAAKAKTAELEQKVKLTEDNAKRQAVYAAIEKGVRDMKIAPASVEILAALALKAEGLVDGTHKFSQDGKTVEMAAGNVSELIAKFAEVQPKVGKTEEKGEQNDKQAASDQEIKGQDGKVHFTDDELDKRVQKVMKEKNLQYTDALDLVTAEIAAENRAKEAK